VSSTTSTPVGSTKISQSTNTPDPRRWLALAVIAIAQLMVVLDASIVTIALPRAQQDLGISDADRQWVVTAYTLAFGGLLLLGGRIADFVGRKRIFLIGLLGFAAASAVGGAAQNEFMLLGARALQGAFAALLAPAALSLITVTFTEARERAKAFGVYGAIAGGGAALGLILGGVLTEYASWRWCLFVNVPIAIAAALAALPTVHESRADGDRHYDIPGAVLVTGGLAALVYGFTEAAKPGVGWLSGSTLTLLVLSVVMLVGFVVVEMRTSHPLLPLRIAVDRNRGGSFLASLLVGAGLFAMFLFLTYYFQINMGYSPLKSGFAFLPFSLGIIVTAGLASALLPRTGPKPLMVTGLVMATAGLFYLTQLGADSSWLTHVLPAEIVMSVEPCAVRCRAARRGCRECIAEHHAADRWLAGHGAAEHAVRERRDELPRLAHAGRGRQGRLPARRLPARLPGGVRGRRLHARRSADRGHRLDQRQARQRPHPGRRRNRSRPRRGLTGLHVIRPLYRRFPAI
jgi:EmrB/QacA subfamily drug resistance transporter